MGAAHTRPETPPLAPQLNYSIPQHRRSASSITGSRSRISSTCPTPPVLQARDYDDDCRVLRRTLGAVHKLCKNKPRQIEAISQSLGRASGRDGPDGGLAMYVLNFDNSVTALYRILSYHTHVLHTNKPPLDVHEFSDDLGKLAVDIERWGKEFNGLVFPGLAPANSGKKGQRELRGEARALGDRCFKAAGKLDALVCLDDMLTTETLLGRLARLPNSQSVMSARMHSRTPSPVPSNATAASGVPFGSASASNGRGSTPPNGQSGSTNSGDSGRGAGPVGVA